ncbi:hypothetical protein BJ742DRAFT_778064 [Cladochytrium replicatum]|nr:hypothetical protein BJ742DRAFT_778064 [Cladochytrium replicatum]
MLAGMRASRTCGEPRGTRPPRRFFPRGLIGTSSLPTFQSSLTSARSRRCSKRTGCGWTACASARTTGPSSAEVANMGEYYGREVHASVLDVMSLGELLASTLQIKFSLGLETDFPKGCFASKVNQPEDQSPGKVAHRFYQAWMQLEGSRSSTFAEKSMAKVWLFPQVPMFDVNLMVSQADSETRYNYSDFNNHSPGADALRLMKRRDCERPHDKIYGMRGLLRYGDKFGPVWEVFTDGICEAKVVANLDKSRSIVAQVYEALNQKISVPEMCAVCGVVDTSSPVELSGIKIELEKTSAARNVCIGRKALKRELDRRVDVVMEQPGQLVRLRPEAIGSGGITSGEEYGNMTGYTLAVLNKLHDWDRLSRGYVDSTGGQVVVMTVQKGIFKQQIVYGVVFGSAISGDKIILTNLVTLQNHPAIVVCGASSKVMHKVGWITNPFVTKIPKGARVPVRIS